MISLYTYKQLIRFSLVGILSNSLLFSFYVVLTTYMGIGYKLTMSILYACGVTQTFFLNKKWSFQHKDSLRYTFIRYVVSYILGYLLNFLALVIFVDYIGFPHTIIQGVMIFIVSLFIFLLQKIWVFKATDSGKESDPIYIGTV